MLDTMVDPFCPLSEEIPGQNRWNVDVDKRESVMKQKTNDPPLFIRVVDRWQQNIVLLPPIRGRQEDLASPGLRWTYRG